MTLDRYLSIGYSVSITNPKPVDKLTKNQKNILGFLRKNPNASYQETADGTKLNKGSVQRGIKSLQTKGILSRHEPVWVIHNV